MADLFAPPDQPTPPLPSDEDKKKSIAILAVSAVVAVILIAAIITRGFGYFGENADPQQQGAMAMSGDPIIGVWSIESIEQDGRSFLWSEYSQFMELLNPEIGVWEMNFTGDGHCEANVRGSLQQFTWVNNSSNRYTMKDINNGTMSAEITNNRLVIELKEEGFTGTLYFIRVS